MSNKDLPVLRNHKLSHIQNLKVADSVFQKRFVKNCSIYNCDATCCQGGVLADLEERANILAHAELIKKYMEPHQDQDHSQWFDEEEEVDLDYPSGRAVGTQVRDYGCVFLDSQGRCVLQTTATEEGMSKFALKPFFCFAYPITIEDGVLMVDDPSFTERRECCSAVDAGDQSVFDVCDEEFCFILGEEGLQELHALAERKQSESSTSS